MTSFEWGMFVLNLIIALTYAAILWVMVQQRRLMDRQLETMQAQLREAERTRMAAYRPILRVEAPFWTLYDIITQTQTFGEGEPPHLRR